ncbi:ribonuclease H-like domain-containing protein [Tanacetum coccineum]|uniref:Ribonuclease H-like domain-containing protein n=1 Tax=Tanacetum coccineum TaxID=301880 RepID=A0ABQ5APQ9_9ASTR
MLWSIYGLKHAPLGTDTAYLLLYVEDIVTTTSSATLLRRIITSLLEEFSMTYFGSLNYFLGVLVTLNSSRMTPVDTESKLEVDGDHACGLTLYCSFTGELHYLTFTRSHISYVMEQLYSSSSASLIAYSDVDWDGCPTTRRSTCVSHCVFLCSNLLSWSSERHVTLFRSNAEAEYRGVANSVAQTCWLRNLLHEFHMSLSSANLVYCDNASAVYLSSNSVQH